LRLWSIRKDKKMNRLMAVISIMMLIMISCGEKEKIVEVPVATDCVPSPPRGVYSANLNGTVEICWYPNYYEDDIESYIVYRGTSLSGDFFPIGTVLAVTPDPVQYCFEDLDTGNGIQYYYGVSAVDGDGRISDLIVEEIVSGTPRPEAQLTLYDVADLPDLSGYDFYPGLSNNAQPYDESTTDLFFGVDTGTPMLIARRAGVEIQDFGYASDFDAIGVAPDDGWAPSRTVEAIARHMYFLRLREGSNVHYAKIYVTAVTGDFATFYWAFQTDPGNPDLSPPAPGRGTGKLSSAYPDNALPGPIVEATLLTDRFSDPPIVERVTWTRDSEFGHQTAE
jgi:hypothetical protein